MTAKPPTKAQKARYDAIVKLGCIVGRLYGFHACRGRRTIHHCGTGGGGRKNHDYTICLCLHHHTGSEGIDGKMVSKRKWQERFGSELKLFENTRQLLKECDDGCD